MGKTVTLETTEVKAKMKTDEALKYRILLAIAIYLLFTSLFFDQPRDILKGLKIILISPSALITDYFELAGVGASLANAAIMMFFAILLVKQSGAKVTGLVMASVIMVAAFSLFGKNPYNAMSIVFGAFLYSRMVKKPFKDFILAALFGTCLGPLVSEVSFNMDFMSIHGIILGKMLGISLGILICYFAPKCMSLHKGMMLYNIGFTAGLISTVIITLMRLTGLKFFSEPHLPAGENTRIGMVLVILFFGMIVVGLKENDWSFRGYGKLLSIPGKSGTDFIETSGIGLSLINMAFLGLLTLSYIYFIGGCLSGPSIGGIFSVMGFGASGKHLKNVIPVMLGIYTTAILSEFDVKQTTIIFAMTFGTALAPISGIYGPLAGFLAGFLHLNLVVHTSALHAGMNLYNNGFSAGIITVALVPVFEMIRRWRENRKILIHR